MSKLLINEPPLMVLPRLAEAIGLNEAIALQQIHFHEGRIGEKRDERMWIRRSLDEWQKDFPFWSRRTIMRIFANLVSRGLIDTTDTLNWGQGDHTNWYSINRGELDKLELVEAPEIQKHSAKVSPSHDSAKMSPSIKGSYQREESRPHEEDNDNSFRVILSAYERWIGPLTPMLVDQMREAAALYSPDWITEALELTQQRFIQNPRVKPSLAYALGIVRRWGEDGYDGAQGGVTLTEIDKANLAALGIDL